MNDYSVSAYDLPRATRKIWNEINGAICTVKFKYNVSYIYNVPISKAVLPHIWFLYMYLFGGRNVGIFEWAASGTFGSCISPTVNTTFLSVRENLQRPGANLYSQLLRVEDRNILFWCEKGKNCQKWSQRPFFVVRRKVLDKTHQHRMKILWLVFFFP